MLSIWPRSHIFAQFMPIMCQISKCICPWLAKYWNECWITMNAHLLNRVNGLHDPVLQELEVTELDRIVHAVVLQVLVAQTLLCSGQVANPNSLVPAWLELQLVVLKLTVKAEVPAIVCRSMFEILHSPIAKLNVAHLDKHWEHKGWSAPSHALSEASIITSQQEATSASGWFSWVRFFGRLVRHWCRLECPSNGCEEKPDKLSTNEQNRSAGGPQHQVSWTVSAHIECLFDPKWILLFPCIFHGLKLLSISWIICHGYLTLE